MASPREALLAEINRALSERGLKSIPKLGDADKGEIEIVAPGIVDIYNHSERFFTDVKFAVKFPNGKTGTFTVRFNANSAVSEGAVFVVLINGMVAVVKEWRLPLGRWVWGIPRGFGEKLDSMRLKGEVGEIGIGDLPLGTLWRELGEEIKQHARIQTITHLGNVAQDSGTHVTCPAYYLIQLRVDDSDLLDKQLVGSEVKQVLKVALWDWAKVMREIGGQLCDAHSIVAVTLAQRHIEGLSPSRRRGARSSSSGSSTTKLEQG